jgi:hypothetical protein
MAYSRSRLRPAATRAAAPARLLEPAPPSRRPYRLGCIGHVRAFTRNWPNGRRTPSNEAVAAHLRELVSNFELKRYMTVLEAMKRNG